MAEINQQEQSATKWSSESSGVGIVSLPADTLIQIIDILREEAEAEYRYGRRGLDKLIMQLSSVSKFFRAVVVGNPAFWTKITSDYIVRTGFEERIARTKNAPLSLELEARQGTKWERILLPILLYKDRWRTLYIDASCRAEQIAKAYPDVQFPALETAALAFDYEEDCVPFVTQWTFPNLKLLKIHGVIPPAGTFSDIITLEITYGFPGDDFTIRDLEKIPKFLAHLWRLERFVLNLSDLLCVLIDPEESFSDVHLPSVKSFTLSNSGHRSLGWLISASAYPAGCLLKCMKLPNVKEFNLSLSFMKDDSVTDWAMMFSISPDTLASVTSLSVSIPVPQDHLALALFLSQFRKVETLAVDVKGFFDTISRPAFRVPLEHLRKLIVKEPEDLPAGWERNLGNLTPNADHLDVSVVRHLIFL